VPLGDVDDGYETIAGYVLDRMGRIPKAGESIETDHLHIRVDRMDRLRIAQVTLTPADSTARHATDDVPARDTAVAD
jgi:CBS domain containing-hemolysin-like protein